MTAAPLVPDDAAHPERAEEESDFGRSAGGKKRDMPGGLWLKCESCRQMIFRKELESRHRVCPNCGFHFTLGARERIEITADPGTFDEAFSDLVPVDRLKFIDSGPYPEKISNAQKKSGMREAIVA